MALTDGLLFYLKLDESSGNAIDAVGGLSGTVTGATQGATGKINTAYSFDGNTDYVNFGNVMDFERTDTRSFQFWVNVAATPSAPLALLTKCAAAVFNGFDMHIRGDVANDPIEFELRGTSTFLTIRANPSTAWDGNWHHIVITYAGGSDSASVKFYMDNNLLTNIDDTTGLSQSVSNAGSLLQGIFIEALLLDDFSGSMDEIAIWNRVLTATEVATAYNGGLAKAYPFRIPNFFTFFD